MEQAFPNLDDISRQLMNVERQQKPKMLVVDDEPDNLDLLYRTFRRDFNVLKADSGINALSLLATEGEVAVIISDQRMPEMKGTEFLSKTVPQFPNTVRIILTGFTDVEDLVEAINSGQVYKYITKPWNPSELRAVVQHAAQTYEVIKQRSEELELSHLQMNLFSSIVQVAQSSNSLESYLQLIAEGFGKNLKADSCILQLVSNNQLTKQQGTYATYALEENCLEQDQLVLGAISDRQPKVWVRNTRGKPPAGADYYDPLGIETHLLIPIIYRNQLLAVLSLQWQQKTSKLPEDKLKLIYLSAQQVGLMLKDIHSP
ncbi:MAG: response regulator [Coleofasciculaceae cyanobacterium]